MDNLEIEIKAYCNDHSQVMKKLSGLGARESGIFREEDTYFNHPARDFRETDEALRVRSCRNESLLTYKGPRMTGRAKTRIEYEVSVGNLATIKKILTALGFVESGIVIKERKKYHLGEIEIALDSVQGLGDFVELEKQGKDRKRTEQELFALAREIGLDQFETKSYLELLCRRS